MSDILVVGATRGLGASLVNKYASGNSGSAVFGTSRSTDHESSTKQITMIPGIDLCSQAAGQELVAHLSQAGAKLGTVIITAGYFATESFDEPKWEEEVKMQVLHVVVICWSTLLENESNRG